jgi:RimJ/RimL family protein N-acetyltransferase
MTSRSTFTLPTDFIMADGRDIVFRAAHPEDAADLITIQQHAIDEGISNVDDVTPPTEERADMIRMLKPHDLYLVAECEGNVVGSVLLRRMPPSFLHHHALLGIELHRDFRGKRLGTALMFQAMEWGRANGIEMLRLGVLDSNPRAKALYERLGFQQTGYIPKFAKRRDGSYSGETQMVLRL